MKRNTRWGVALLSLLLACTMVVSAWVMPAMAAAPAEKLSDETSRQSAEITLSDGTLLNLDLHIYISLHYS